MIRAIRIRLYPTPDQKKYLAGLFGAVRFCYNKALYLKTHFYKVKGVNLHPIHDLKKLIAIAKKSKKYAWLAEYDCMALQESVRNLNKAYGRFFKKEAGYPRFKSRRGEQSSYHCTLIFETLKIQGMMKNHHLAKAIADAGWAEFMRQCEYKAKHEGRIFAKIGTFFPSSKTCSACGHKLKELSLATRRWTCPHCGAQHDRDLNASLNIKQEGIRMLKAAGLTVLRS